MGDAADEDLVLSVRRGNTSAFDELVRRYDKKVRQLVAGIVGEADVDDVAQIAFLSAYRALRSFAETARFSSWLYRIAWNAALMRLRSGRRRREIYIEDVVRREDRSLLSGREAPAAGPDAEIARRQVAAELRDAIAGLPPRYGQVLVLRDLQDMSIDEVCQTLGISVAAVKTRLHRARRGLKAALASMAAAA